MIRAAVGRGTQAKAFLPCEPLMDPTVPSPSPVNLDPLETAAALNALHDGNFAGELGLVMESASRDRVVARFTVTPRHLQPHGIVHGGVYCAVVETVASVGAGLDAFGKGLSAVGLENSTSFVRAVREGTLRVTSTPLTRGRRTQVWEATITTEQGALVATGRVRLLVLDPAAEVAGEKLGTP